MERATAPVMARLSMAELSRELCGWLELPAPAGLPQGLDAVLDSARRSMQGAVAARDTAAVRERTIAGLCDAIVNTSDSVIAAVRSLDPSGVQVGPLAVGRMRATVEQPREIGVPEPGPPYHHGARVIRVDGMGGHDVLLVDFCLQVPGDGPGTITAMLLAGDEETMDNVFRSTEIRRGMPGVELEAAIAQTVAQAAELLPEILDAFARRVPAP